MRPLYFDLFCCTQSSCLNTWTFINVLFRKYIWLTWPQTSTIIQSRTFLHILSEQWQVDMLCVHMCACERERFTDSSLWCPIKHDTLFLSFPYKPLWNHTAVRHTHLNSPSALSSNLLTIFHFFVFHVLTHTLYPLPPPHPPFRQRDLDF